MYAEAPKPKSTRGPDCAHQKDRPASACPICKDDPPVRKWRQDWATWLAEHPDSEEARNGYVRWIADR